MGTESGRTDSRINRPERLLDGFESPVYDVAAREQWSEEVRAESRR